MNNASAQMVSVILKRLDEKGLREEPFSLDTFGLDDAALLDRTVRWLEHEQIIKLLTSLADTNRPSVLWYDANLTLLGEKYLSTVVDGRTVRVMLREGASDLNLVTSLASGAIGLIKLATSGS